MSLQKITISDKDEKNLESNGSARLLLNIVYSQLNFKTAFNPHK